MVKHGTPSSYTNHRCRCQKCKDAWNRYCAQKKRERRAKYIYDPSSENHGTPGEYQKGCSCPPCRKAHSDYSSAVKSSPKPSPTQKCQICGKGGHIWDHDHGTGRFRGWLCVNCNQGLGLFLDNPSLLKKASRYVQR